MRVLLSTYGSRGDVEPLMGAAQALRALGAAHDGPTPTTESLSAALKTTLTPGTRVRAKAAAGTIRADRATVAAKLLLEAISREKPPMPA